MAVDKVLPTCNFRQHFRSEHPSAGILAGRAYRKAVPERPQAVELQCSQCLSVGVQHLFSLLEAQY